MMIILNILLILTCVYLYSQTNRCSYTKLFNKAQFNWDTKHRMRRKKDIIILIDIDGFKQINDTHGHAYGDEIIRELANIIKRHIRVSDRAYRIGGDEFAIITDDASVANRIQVNTGDIYISVGCGKTYEQADAAMYAEKSLHKCYNK